MSHVVAVKTKIKNLIAFATACKMVGATFMEGQRTFQEFYGKQACDHAVRFPGATYEAGLVKTKDGDFEIKCDYWSSGGIKKETTSKLVQAYAEAQVRQSVALTRGQNIVGRQVLPDGSIRLLISA